MQRTITVDEETGNVNQTNNAPFAEFQGLRYTTYPERIEMTGSIHKFYNQGLHNYNDFGLNEVIEANSKLNKLGIDLNSFFSNLEIGVNIETSFNPDRFSDSLIWHKGEPFTDQRSRSKRYRECVHVQYIIKSYDKGKQNKLNRYILRFERKFIVMEVLNKLGIRNLSDLQKPENFKKVGNLLLQTYDDILIGNLQADTSKLNPRDKILFANGHNPAYWKSLIPKSEDYKQGNTDPEYKRQYKRYEKKLNRFKELLTRTGADQLKKDVRELIVQKINQLSVLKKEGEIERHKQIKKRGKLSDTKNRKKGENERLLYRLNYPPTGNQKTEGKTILCCVTGMNISHQRKGSQFLSEKTIRNIYFTHPATFESLCKTFGTRKKKNLQRKTMLFHCSQYPKPCKPDKTV